MAKPTLQSERELDAWHGSPDPWGYETHPDDTLRKQILLEEIPDRQYPRVLDIGCGQGFITRDLPGASVIGIDVSAEAISHAQERIKESPRATQLSFIQASLFDLRSKLDDRFDLIVITGVLYPQYIGDALNLVYHVIDEILRPGGVLVSVHIDDWYRARFPYLMLKEHFYAYREYNHRLEVYVK